MTQPDEPTAEILRRVVAEVRDYTGARIYTKAEMLHAIKLAREQVHIPPGLASTAAVRYTPGATKTG